MSLKDQKSGFSSSVNYGSLNNFRGSSGAESAGGGETPESNLSPAQSQQPQLQQSGSDSDSHRSQNQCHPRPRSDSFDDEIEYDETTPHRNYHIGNNRVIPGPGPAGSGTHPQRNHDDMEQYYRNIQKYKAEASSAANTNRPVNVAVTPGTVHGYENIHCQSFVLGILVIVLFFSMVLGVDYWQTGGITTISSFSRIMGKHANFEEGEVGTGSAIRIVPHTAHADAHTGAEKNDEKHGQGVGPGALSAATIPPSVHKATNAPKGVQTGADKKDKNLKHGQGDAATKTGPGSENGSSESSPNIPPPAAHDTNDVQAGKIKLEDKYEKTESEGVGSGPKTPPISHTATDAKGVELVTENKESDKNLNLEHNIDDQEPGSASVGSGTGSATSKTVPPNVDVSDSPSAPVPGKITGSSVPIVPTTGEPKASKASKTDKQVEGPSDKPKSSKSSSSTPETPNTVPGPTKTVSHRVGSVKTGDDDPDDEYKVNRADYDTYDEYCDERRRRRRRKAARLEKEKLERGEKGVGPATTITNGIRKLKVNNDLGVNDDTKGVSLVEVQDKFYANYLECIQNGDLSLDIYELPTAGFDLYNLTKALS